MAFVRATVGGRAELALESLLLRRRLAVLRRLPRERPRLSAEGRDQILRLSCDDPLWRTERGPHRLEGYLHTGVLGSQLSFSGFGRPWARPRGLRQFR